MLLLLQLLLLGCVTTHNRDAGLRIDRNQIRNPEHVARQDAQLIGRGQDPEHATLRIEITHGWMGGE
jgi:hypothetical protein